MAEAAVAEINTVAEAENAARVYEIGYHISPSVKEDEVEKRVGEMRSMIEKHGGRLLAEGAPSMMKLSYDISVQEGGKRIEYDRASFGWIKFEAPSEAALEMEEALKTMPGVIRSILFKTVREETRARFKPQTLREVKRTDTLKSAPRATEEVAAPVSEEDLEKALSDITAE